MPSSEHQRTSDTVLFASAPQTPLEWPVSGAIHRKDVRQYGGVKLEHNDKLQFSMYTLSGSLDTPVVFYLSDDARGLGHSLHGLRNYAMAEIGRIKQDPFGATNIDPHKASPDVQRRRSVNRVADYIEKAVGQPIAIKALGDTRDLQTEDLLKQYMLMRELEVKAEKSFSPTQKAVLWFNHVYGALRDGQNEYLFLERINNPERTSDIVDGKNLEFVASVESGLHEAFPNLPKRENRIKWNDFAHVISQILDLRDTESRLIELDDINGYNVLWHFENGKKKYVIIDPHAMVKAV